MSRVSRGPSRPFEKRYLKVVSPWKRVEDPKVSERTYNMVEKREIMTFQLEIKYLKTRPYRSRSSSVDRNSLLLHFLTSMTPH